MHTDDGTSQSFFSHWGIWVLRYRWWLIAFIVAITGWMVQQINTRLTIDTSIDVFIPKHAPANQALQTYRQSFGRDTSWVIMAEGDVFTMPFLEKLRALHADLAALDLPHPAHITTDATAPTPDEWDNESGGTVVEDVTSLINARHTYTQDDTLYVGDLLDPWPTAAELPERKRIAMTTAAVQGNLVDTSGHIAVLYLRTRLMHGSAANQIYADLRQVLDRYNNAQTFKISLAGMPAMDADMGHMIIRDVRVLLGLAWLTIVVILIVLFRHALAVLGPVLVVLLAAIWTLGMMAYLGYPVTILSNILPAFLICVGVGDSIHFISTYRDVRRAGISTDEAIVRTLASAGIPIVLTSTTTMAGLLSFRFADMRVIGEMGTIGAFGVGAALFQSLVLLPIILHWHRRGTMGAHAQSEVHANSWMSRAVAQSNRFAGAWLHPYTTRIEMTHWQANRSRRRTLWTALALTIIATVGILTLRVYHHPLSWIPTKYGVRQAFDQFDEKLSGVMTAQLLFEPTVPDGLKDVRLLHAMERLQQHILAYEDPSTHTRIVTYASSVLDILKETNQALHHNDPAWYRLPDTNGAARDLLFLFENSKPDQLRRLVTIDLSKAQMTFRIKYRDANAYVPLVHYIQAGIDRYMGNLAKVTSAGSIITMVSIVPALITDLIYSFCSAFALIAIMMIVLLRSVKMGLLAMIPNLLPVALVMGVMGFSGIPIDVVNLLIGSIAIGIAVDDTIHFTHHFRQSFNKTGDLELSIAAAFQQCGHAMIATSIILILGFSVYMGASMYNIQRFGIIVACTILFALLGDLILMPAILRTFYRDKTTTKHVHSITDARPSEMAR